MQLTLTMVLLAKVFFANAQIAKFFCWLIAKDRKKMRNIFLKTICLFLTMLIDVCLPQLSSATLLQIWLCKLTMLFYQIVRFDSNFGA